MRIDSEVENSRRCQRILKCRRRIAERQRFRSREARRGHNVARRSASGSKQLRHRVSEQVACLVFDEVDRIDHRLVVNLRGPQTHYCLMIAKHIP